MSDDSVLDAVDALIAGLKQEDRQSGHNSIIYNNSLEPQNQFHISKQATTRNPAVDHEKFSTDSVNDILTLRSSPKSEVASGFVATGIVWNQALMPILTDSSMANRSLASPRSCPDRMNFKAGLSKTSVPRWRSRSCPRRAEPHIWRSGGG